MKISTFVICAGYRISALCIDRRRSSQISILKVEKRENQQLAWSEIEENKKKEEHNRRIRRGKCKALARPARFHGFITFRVATRGLLTPFDCPSKRLRAPRKRSASRIHDAFFFSLIALLTKLSMHRDAPLAAGIANLQTSRTRNILLLSLLHICFYQINYFKSFKRVITKPQ